MYIHFAAKILKGYRLNIIINKLLVACAGREVLLMYLILVVLTVLTPGVGHRGQ